MAALPDVPGFAVTATGVLGSVLSASDAVTGYAGAQLVASAFSGAIECQGSFDGGSTYVALQVVNMADGSTATNISAAGIYRVDVGTVPRHRWNCVTFVSATAATLYPTNRIG